MLKAAKVGEKREQSTIDYRTPFGAIPKLGETPLFLPGRMNSDAPSRKYFSILMRTGADRTFCTLCTHASASDKQYHLETIGHRQVPSRGNYPMEKKAI